MQPKLGEQVWWLDGVELKTGVLVAVRDGMAEVNHQGQHMMKADYDVHTFRRSAIEAKLAWHRSELLRDRKICSDANRALLVRLAVVRALEKRLHAEPPAVPS